MADTTVTFAIVGSQADVELVNDRTKPSWDDFLNSDAEKMELAKKGKGEKERDRQRR